MHMHMHMHILGKYVQPRTSSQVHADVSKERCSQVRGQESAIHIDLARIRAALFFFLDDPWTN